MNDRKVSAELRSWNAVKRDERGIGSEAFWVSWGLENTMGANMRAVREAKGVPVEVLAKWTGISYGSIRNIESGKTSPRLTTVVRLATALRVSVDEYIGFPREEEPEPDPEWDLYIKESGERREYRYGPSWKAMQLMMEGGYKTPEEAKAAWLKEWEEREKIH